jgi:hypothetical protein
VSNAKSKSQKRFEQLNRIVDRIAPTLQTPSQVAVLLVCYRHAFERGHFRVSIRRIADATRLSTRQVMRVMDQLRRLGVIDLLEEHRGPVPAQYRITGELANSDTGVTNKSQRNTQQDGDIDDR